MSENVQVLLVEPAELLHELGAHVLFHLVDAANATGVQSLLPLLLLLALLAKCLDACVLLHIVQVVVRRLAARLPRLRVQARVALLPLRAAIVTERRHSIIMDSRLKHDVSDEAGLGPVEVAIATQLVEQPLEWLNLELVEGWAHVVCDLVHLIVVVGAGGEALEEEHGLLGDDLPVAVLADRLVHLDLLQGERVRVLSVIQVRQPVETNFE